MLSEPQGRRRKIKCTYEDEVTEICHECAQYGRVCERQSSTSLPRPASKVHKPNNQQRLKVRVTRLESVIQHLSKTLPELVGTSGSNSITGLELMGSKLGGRGDVDTAGGVLKHETEPSPPIYALFKNEVVSHFELDFRH